MIAMDSSIGIDEGEIIESGSEKANKSPRSVNGNSVDRPSRTSSVKAHDNSADDSDARRSYRGRSANPDSHARGEQRGRDAYHDYDHDRSDPRRFRVHYEDRSNEGRRGPRVSNAELDYGTGSASKRRHDRRDDDRRHHKRPRTRSRSPMRRSREWDHRGRAGKGQREERRAPYQQRHDGDRSYQGGRSRQVNAQSVSEQGDVPVPPELSRSEAELRTKGSTQDLASRNSADATRLGGHQENVSSQAAADDGAPAEEALDEAALIEERRKKREAIKAKYRGQATPLLVQALQLGGKSGTTSPSSASRMDDSGTASRQMATPQELPLLTPQEGVGPNSAMTFSVMKDEDLANHVSSALEGVEQDGPSAADYDPTMDMREDRERDDQRHHDAELPSGAYDETKTTQDVHPSTEEASVGQKTKKADEFDMFAEEDADDMFAGTPSQPVARESEHGPAAEPVPAQAKRLDMSMLDDWDDHEGYYKIILGELLDGRYHVQANLGKGMFSGVVRAMDAQTNTLVAIKLIRNNETMRKAGLKEIEILQKLNNTDPDDRKHMIRLERHFEHKSHLCMVFENLSINLREVLKKFGRDVGINLRAVRAYAQQMLLGLSLLRKCNILHADLKPDNILVNASRNLLKVCDLGSASDASDNEITPYLVSRFYRAPEIILGMPYDFAIDVWSVGCTLFELYTGKILFTGRTNNQMLRSMMECRGKFSHKLLRRGDFAGLHFDDLLNFRSVERDRVTGRDVVRILPMKERGVAGRDIKSRVTATAGKGDEAEMKEAALFADLLERCLNLNPEKRITAAEALRHPFIMRPAGK